MYSNTMTEFQRAMQRLEKSMPSGMAFFGFLLIVFGILGVLTTSSELSQLKKSTDLRKQASEPGENLPAPPEGCAYYPTQCQEPDCQITYELICAEAPYPVAPARPDGKIIWELPDAAMRADAMTIILADGREFTTRDIQVRISSDPISVTDTDYTTLEGIWYEQNVEMRLNMYIYKNPLTNIWYVEELRVYNGNTPGDWISFNKPQGLTGATAGQPLEKPGNFTLQSTSPEDAATLRFTNLSLQAFLRKPPYCNELGRKPADISGDEHVDILDITTMTSSFFQTGDLDSDLTCNEVVDLEDYTVLINELQL